MSARTRRSLTLLWAALFLCSLLMQYGSFAAPASVLAASGLLAGTVQGFEIDGDLRSGNASTNPAAVPDGPPPPDEPDLVDTLTNGDDWLDGASGSGVIDPPSPPGSALINDPTDDQSDDIFIGGAKEDDTCTWGYTTGKPTGKDDFDHVMAYAKFVGTNAYFYAGVERLHTVGGGDTTIDFELNRNLFRSFNGGPVVADRSEGDLLISLEFANGGSNPEVRIFQVTSVTACATGEKVVFTEKSNAQVSNAVHSATNFGPVAGFSGAGNADPIATFDFAEISIDLHALGIDPSCPGFAAGHIRSRAGGDIDSSQLKDTSAPFPIDLNTCGQVTIVKDAVPNHAQDFAFSGDLGAFSLDDDSNATLPNSTTFTDVAPGTYDVTEVAVSGWDLTNLVCDDANSVEDLGTRNAEIHVEANEHVTCTFTNTKRGSITIVKDAQPDDDDDFPFTTTGSGVSSFSLDDDANATLSNTNTFTDLAPGAYTVTEGAVGGWDLVNLVCTDPSSDTTPDLAGRSASIALAAGESVTCTYTNAKRGSVVIIKNAIPDDSQDFSFSTSGGDLTPTTFSLEDNGDELDGSPNTRTFNFVTSGPYTVSEDGESGWDLTGISCDDPTSDSSGNVGTGVASINVSNGETVTCTFTNTKRGRIIVDKVTVPGGDPQSFSFDATGAGYADFSLTDAAAANSQEVLPGEYSVAETVPTGWDLTSATCDQGETPDDIDVGPGETVTCTFTNVKDATVTIVKDAVPNDAQDFGYTGSFGAFSLDDDANATLSNSTTFTVPAAQQGAKSVTETAVAGWDLTDLDCVGDGDSSIAGATANLVVDPGESITCTYVNTKRGHIIVDKVTNPSADPAVFDFDASGAGYADFTLTDAASPNDSGALVPGEYSVRELDEAGWDLTGLTCDDANGSVSLLTGTASLTLDPGETINCTFTNTKRGTIIVVKDAVPDSAQDFAFTTTGAGLSGFSLDDDADATLLDSRTFTNLVPGEYGVSETDPGSAWDLGALDCTEGTANSSEDLGTATADITLDPGETVTCTFVNVQRGSITIIKDAVPNGPTNFSYTGSFGAFQLDDDADSALSNTISFVDQVSGEYSVSETLAAGWDLDSVVCNGTNGSGGVRDGNAADITLTDGGSVTCTFTNRLPAIQVVKTAGSAADGAVLVAAPGNVTYTYVVTNTGQTVLNGVSVVDDNGTPANPADDFAATCEKTTLAIGESMTCTATVSVTANRTNIALAEGTSPGGNDVSDTDDAVVRVPGRSIDKAHNDADGIVGRGQEVTYTILATISQGPVTNAVITDTLPAGQTYVGGSQTSAPAATSFAVSADGRTLTWTYASLSTGATLTYKVTIDAGAPTGNQTNTVQICVSELPGCPSDTTTVRVPTLTILKGVAGNTAGQLGGVPQAKEGDTLTFTLTYDLTNGPVTGGVITDVLPVGYSYVAGSATSSSPGGEFTFTSFNAATRTLRWNAPTVTQDGSVSYRVVILTGAAELPQPLINVATIDSNETAPDDDDQPVLVQVPPLAATATPRITPPPTDLDEQAPSNPGFTLMLVLLGLAGFVLTVGYLTPVPERARRRDRR